MHTFPLKNLYEVTLECECSVRSHIQHSRRLRLLLKETGVAPASSGRRPSDPAQAEADRQLLRELSENKQPLRTEASRHPPFMPTAVR